MAQAWQTVEEAALTLGISVRTLHRRIAKGELQSRLEAGRREVFVEIPDPEPIPSDLRDAENDIFESSAKTVSQQAVGIHPDMHNTMLQLHEDRLRRTDLAILAYQQSVMTAAAEARRSRIMARVAWGTVAIAVAGLFTIGVWSTQKLSSAEAEVVTVKRELQAVESDADAKAAELEKLRGQADEARLAAARAEGELKAKAEPIRVIQEVRPAPTTQPSSLVGKLFSGLGTE
jgi:hypothetical protein